MVPEGVRWCQQHISRRFPQFRFRVADIFNGVYNPEGKWKAAEFPFPYEDEGFDFVILTSIFTHMLPDDMEHYFGEVARVLRTGGRCLITFFLLNPESEELMRAGKSGYYFPDDLGRCRVMDRRQPEAAVAYEEGRVLHLFEQHGLRVHQPVQYGSWCGRAKYRWLLRALVARAGKRARLWTQRLGHGRVGEGKGKKHGQKNGGQAEHQSPGSAVVVLLDAVDGAHLGAGDSFRALDLFLCGGVQVANLEEKALFSRRGAEGLCGS